MKTILKIFLSLLLLPWTAAVFGQNTEQITAVKLKASIGEQYYNKLEFAEFTVDKNYILRPKSSYKITYFATEKKIAIHPKTMKLISAQPAAPGFDVTPVPGGTMFCLCDKAEDDCKTTFMILDNTLAYTCGGSCGCGSFIIYDTSDPVLEYQVPGGGCFRF
ncbi:MAG: hypothetical protein IPN76_26865 [Saprospiraceae bacterium]|nr:hypothetical protein [Saprospiraceae bacterium]